MQEKASAVNSTQLLTAPPAELWSLPEVAAYLGLGKDHRDPISAVRHLCRVRKLKHIKIGKTLRCRRAWVDEFLEKEAVKPLD